MLALLLLPCIALGVWTMLWTLLLVPLPAVNEGGPWLYVTSPPIAGAALSAGLTAAVIDFNGAWHPRKISAGLVIGSAVAAFVIAAACLIVFVLALFPCGAVVCGFD